MDIPWRRVTAGAALLFNAQCSADFAAAAAKFDAALVSLGITTTPEERDAPFREYQQKTSGGPIKIMTYLLLGLTGAFAVDLGWRKRFPHQRGFDVRDLLRR